MQMVEGLIWLMPVISPKSYWLKIALLSVCAMAATSYLISSNCKLPTNEVSKCKQHVKKDVSEPTRVYQQWKSMLE